jgi:2-(1,2-epoxy-1,2-dihydrophenyl)acetyl-CoA isomerase
MLGEKLPAEEAEKIGMIYKVLEDDNFQEQAFGMAANLAQMPTKALALTKQALSNSLVNNYEDQLHDEEILQERAGRTQDYKEGVQAFLEKRKPNFTGQ